MGCYRLFLVLAAAIAAETSAQGECFSSVGGFEAKWWAERVIPLPKEMLVHGVQRMRAGDVLATCADQRSPQCSTALSLLRTICRSDCKSAAFTLRLMLADGAKGYADSSVIGRLKALPNADQAYHIEPTARRDGLIVLANTPTGLLFAARTLVQLIQAPAKLTSGSRLAIPLTTITDWPDIAERGQWGGDVTAHIAETSRYKLNVIEQPVKVSVDEEGNPTSALSSEWTASALAQGVKIVPVITHLEQISRYARLADRPDVISTPDPSKPLPSDYVPGLCMSSQATRDIIRGWLDKIADTEGVSDIMVWLSEERSPCFCKQCLGREQYELEVQAIASAFETVRNKKLGVRLRLLTTQGSYSVNDKVIAAAPSDVGISYYDGSRTYDSSRRPMIYPLLEGFAKSDRWLGVYPQITHSWRTVFPWTAPQFIKYRAQEFADKSLNNVIGYAVPSNCYHDFNVLALAEWTWNAHGRTPSEFARAYALKRGIRNPELFAEWALLAGDAGWSLAESRMFLYGIYNPSLGLLSGSRFEDRFGQASILDPKKLEEAISTARRAADLAADSKNPDLISESKCCLAGLEAFAAMKALAPLLVKQPLDPIDKEAAREALDSLDGAAEVLREELRAWGERMRKCTTWARLPSRLVDTAHALLRTCDDFRARAVKLGVPDPHPERRLARVGEWSANDFTRGSEAALSWDITEFVPSNGAACNIAFDFVWSSAYGTGLKSLRVVEALGSSRKIVCVAGDHLGRLSRSEPRKEALVEIPARASGSKLFVELDCVGPPPDAPEDRRTCSGVVGIRQVGPWR